MTDDTNLAALVHVIGLLAEGHQSTADAITGMREVIQTVYLAHQEEISNLRAAVIALGGEIPEALDLDALQALHEFGRQLDQQT